VLRGKNAFFDFDAVAKVAFDDEAAYQAFIESLGTEEATAKIAADEDKFSDAEGLRIVVIGDIEETK
jgi:EthD domain